LSEETKDYIYLEIKSKNKKICINSLDETTKNKILDDLKNIGLHFKSVDKGIIWIGCGEEQ